MKSSIKVIFFFYAIMYFNVGNAYQHQNCMQGIAATSNLSAQLDEAFKKMGEIQISLIRSGVVSDVEAVGHLLNVTEVTSVYLSGSLVITLLRQLGNFKQTESVNQITSLHFQSLFTQVKYAKTQFIKTTGALKNASLREQSFEIAQQLEKISNQLTACEK